MHKPKTNMAFSDSQVTLAQFTTQEYSYPALILPIALFVTISQIWDMEKEFSSLNS